MEIEVLSGKGIVRVVSLDNPVSAGVNGNGPFMAEVEPIELLRGTKLTIPANSRIQYEATYGPLIVRDTSLGFNVHNEVPTAQHLVSRGEGSGSTMPALSLS